MPKRKAKKDTKQNVSSQSNNLRSIDQEVEHQIALIRKITEAELGRTLTGIRLLKSRINKEQLETPLLQFFEENLPNVTISTTEKNGLIKVKWKDIDEGNLISYFLQRMSMTNNPECSTAIPSVGGFDFSSQGKTSLIGADNLQMKDFELSDTHIIGFEESMQTPGVSSSRLSVGMTPKTLRLPKQGEMLLSVHGSPLGVFKENNMDAIHETEEE